jgi:hypothetical protein
MIRIPRHHLEERARQRPLGYFEDVESAGVWSEDGKELLLEVPVWERLCAKYQNTQAEQRRPGLVEMISHFGSAVAAWAAEGFPVVTAVQFHQRLEVCRGCEHWMNAVIPHCTVCSCSKLKHWLSTEKCPKGKW